MRLEVVRINSAEDSTLGVLYERLPSGRRFLSFTLEDEFRTQKRWGETRIPAGTYPITLRTTGGHHARYLRRYPQFHHGMLWVRDVPNFEYILIHIGNTDDDTAGCLLVGDVAKHTSIGQSAVAYQRIYRHVAPAVQRGEVVTIQYTNLDTPA